jgi:ABC-type uncharacterized transport system involved in gliding motility auxiliary subunit
MGQIEKQTGLLLTLLVVAFLLFTLVNQTLLSGLRLDLTEEQLFTLNDGSREVIAEIDEPLNFYFFFSESASRDLSSLRAYAAQIEALLKEFEAQADGKIKLRVIDPEPFSENEDMAASFGLQSVPVNNAGEELYFGLAATNSLDDQVVIAFFQPDKEAFLEYEISQTIQTLGQKETPRIGLMSSIKVEGDIDMQTFQTTPPWMVIEQLQQRYEVETIQSSATELPTDLSLIILIHPKGLSDETLYAIDQFVMTGGRLLVFLDPLAEMEQANNAMPSQVAGAPSELAKLLEGWGLSLRQGVVLADSETALTVGGPDGQPVRHLTIIGPGPDNFSDNDLIIAGIESLNFASAGILDVVPTDGIEIEPLVQLGPFASPVSTTRVQILEDPEELQRDFTPDGESHVIAVRLTGEIESAFTGSELVSDNHIAVSKNLNAIVVADTDLLADRLWVQVQSFFGQRIASPFAGNGDFVINAVDNLAGSSALISIRSRGRYSRPFDVVQDLRREAEARYLTSADELQSQLLETESRLAELNASQSDSAVLSVSPEQEAELLRFQEDKLRIRKELREVRHQLDKDIESLGATLKFLNILLIPLLLTLGLMMMNYIRMRGSEDVSR